MPPPSSASSSPVAYKPRNYQESSGTGTLRLMALGLLIAALVAGGIVAWRTWPSRDDRAMVDTMAGDGAAQPVAAREQAEADAMQAGWVGMLELPQGGAAVTIATLDPASRFAREFVAKVSQPVGLATISIDNSEGKGEVIVNPTGAMLHMRGGAQIPALDSMDVLATVTTDRAGAQRDLSPPYRCGPGQKLAGKLLLLPQGVNPQDLAAVTLHVNMQPQEITGRFMDEAEKAKLLQSGRLRAGGL